jgi:23S rRNA (adenine2503-C2)-methyltransferase
MTALLGLLPSEVAELTTRLGLPRYRSDQLLHAVYQQGLRDINDLAAWPRAAREALAAEGFEIGLPDVETTLRSDDGETTKSLLRLRDGTLVETVLMQYPSPGKHPRSTVCVSTQAGCAMGCVFCATGQMGFERNLAAGEIVGQVLHFANILRERGQHVTNVVFMGMGEPLANYNETIKAVRILVDPAAFGLGQRSITLSTVGVLRGIERLADEGLQVGLAISLHSPDNARRKELVPTATADSVDRLLQASRDYFRKTGRRVTFEYALVSGENDSPEAALELAHRLRGSGAHVNLIPVNPTAGGYERPARRRVVEFERILRESGINATVRVEKGTEIAAACGQLRTDADANRPVIVPLSEEAPRRRQGAPGPASSPHR